MNSRSVATRDSETRWLQGLLRKRIASGIVLAAHGSKDWRLGLEGDGHTITILGDRCDFMENPTDPAIRWLEIESEGFEGALPGPLPAPGSSTDCPIWRGDENGGVLSYDIPGLVAWALSRKEEIGRRDLDAHGRFPATASHAFRHGYLERPIVDEWLGVLGQLVQRVWPGVERVRPVFSMKVSHDVDSPSRYAFGGVTSLARTMVGDLVRRKNIGAFFKAPIIRLDSRHSLSPKDPSNTFAWIMDQSERHGLQSAFYFICGRTAREKDAAYEPEDPRILKLMRRIHERGHEIGLHPSYGTYRDPALLAGEAARLRDACRQAEVTQEEWGGRMHFLRWETPTTLYGWERAGMDYDSSMSYADRPGFRCGTCFEYNAFDPLAGKELKLRIRPLIAMECTVMAPRYLGLGVGEAAYSKFTQLKEACRVVGGSFTTLWHNTYFEDNAAKRLYQALLSH